MLTVLSANGPSGFAVKNSLRFRSSASAYLSRTPASAGNQQTWTWSGWVKKGKLTTFETIFHAASSTSNRFHFDFDGAVAAGAAGDILSCFAVVGGVQTNIFQTNALFRDPSSWYHLLIAVDTTQATSTNRVKLYVNGVAQTFAVYNAPTQNSSLIVNSTVNHTIASYAVTPGTYTFDGYMAEVNFIDGQALDPSYFGQISPITGVWSPAPYVGSYGTNGFYLKFTDTTSTTTLCYDYSGNSNNWTPNNISLTAGSTYDSMLDSPTNYDNGGNGVGNYAVLNPLNRTGSTFSDIDGNLNWTGSSTQIDRIYGTIGLSSGKWYWEVTMSGSGSSTYYFWVGIAKGASTTSSYDSTGLGYWGGNDATITGKFNNRNTSTNTAYGASWTFGDVIGVALDMDSGTLTFYKNGASQGVAISTINSSYPGTYFPMTFSDGGASGSFVYSYNFGQRPFAYTPPTGYKALNTQNLPAPSIQNGANFMAATSYTGNGATRSIVNAVNGVSFAPDFIWCKRRDTSFNHRLNNKITGTSATLFTNNTDAETTWGGLDSFNSNGFSISGDVSINASGGTYVAWQWKAGGTAVTNTAGSITSSVSANTTSGFSVVTFTCNAGGSGTFGHGLGVAPNMVIIKSRTTATSWFVGHTAIGWTNYLFLNTTAASAASTSVWNDTAPSSTVVTLGSGFTSGVYGSMAAYCFAAIPGYSAFGSYTGNGSADGPFIYCGFRPRYVLIKRTDSAADWTVWDTSRNTYNVSTVVLCPNLSSGESAFSSGYEFDILSNGFKCRSTGNVENASGGTYIYAAFAESPLKFSLAR